MEFDRFKESQGQARLSEVFAKKMVVKTFKWANQGVIFLNLKVKNAVAKAV